MRKVLLLILYSFLCLPVIAQKEWSNWYFNGRNMLTFKNGFAEAIQNYISPLPAETDIFHFYNWGTGGISYSDPITGDMKFIISNKVGFGADFRDFPEDNFIRSCPDKFSYHIIPFHNNPKKFYVVQFQDFTADYLAMVSGLQVRCPNAINLGYSTVDLNLNGGSGGFASVNTQLSGPLTSHITMVRHANGIDTWVIVHSSGSNQFASWLFTDNGVEQPIYSSIGPAMIAGPGWDFSGISGTLTASHDGKLLAAFSANLNALQLYDFNTATGSINNYRTVNSIGTGSRMQFSPDNSKLYYLNYKGVYQYDLSAPDIGGSLVDLQIKGNLYDMQLAPDGKIYISSTYKFDPVTQETEQNTGAIECPNLPQFACNINTIALAGSQVAFPDLINDFIKSPVSMPPITHIDLGNDTAICFGSVQLSAPAGWDTYRWNTGETTRQITVVNAGIYYVLAGDAGFSCPAAYGHIKVTDKAIKLDLGQDTSMCPNDTYALHVDDLYSDILWENGSHVRDSVITSSSFVMISAHDKNGCLTKDTIDIHIKSNLDAKFGSDTTLCNSSSLNLKLYPPANWQTSATYLWQDGSILDNFTVQQSGTYWGKVIYGGCEVSDTIKIDYATTESVYLGKDTSRCAGDSILLNVSVDNARYKWNTGDTTKSIYVKESGSYWVRVTTSVCSLSDTITVNFNTVPSISLGNDTTVCDKIYPILKSPYSADTYLWQDGTTTEDYKAKSAGLYWLKVTQNGCSSTDSVFVSFKPLPQVFIGSDTVLCDNNHLLLHADGVDISDYLWQDQSSQSSYNISSEGEYSVKVKGKNGCYNSDTIKISYKESPSFSLGNDTVLCAQKQLPYRFDFDQGLYLWNNLPAGNSYVISSPGIYTLAITSKGCSSYDTISVKYKSAPTLNLGKDTTLCQGNSITLNAYTSGATYTWQDRTSEPIFKVSKAGVYSVEAMLNGCLASDTINISYKLSPSISLGQNTILCVGQSLILKPTVSGEVQYLWQDGSTASQYTVRDSGLYRLTVSNRCGTAADEISVESMICSLDLPKAFTPNGDGVNDIFRIKYPVPVTSFKMAIYSKWGQKVFESSDIRKGWNGKFGGISMETGAYIWVISIVGTDRLKQVAKGTILLLR